MTVEHHGVPWFIPSTGWDIIAGSDRTEKPGQHCIEKRNDVRSWWDTGRRNRYGLIICRNWCKKCVHALHHKSINRHGTTGDNEKMHLLQFERWTQSEILVNKLSQKVRRHPHFASRATQIIKSNKAICKFVEHGSTVEPKAHVNLFSAASKDDSTIWHKHVWRRSGEVQVAKTAHQRKVDNVKKQSPSTSSTQLEIDTDSPSSQANLIDSDKFGLGNKRRPKCHQELQRLHNATKNPILLGGTILLFVKIGELAVRIWFGIVEKLAVDILFRTSFIHRYIQSVFSSEK